MNYRRQNNFSGGFRDVVEQAAQQSNQQIANSITTAIQNRFALVDQLLEWGEPYYLPISLGIPAGALDGATNQVVSNNQDFDLLIIGAASTIYKSSIEILDSSRNKLLTNGSVPISSLASFASGSVVVQPWNWSAPYLLPAKAILNITVTADGTESGGVLTLRCIQPPVAY